MGNMIELQNVSKTLNSVFAVSDVTFQVTRGEAISLIGPSGSGKTTVLRLIAGLEVPDSGTIFLNGHLASKSGWACPPYQRGVGMVFQQPSLWPHMTVAQNVLFGLCNMARPEAEQRLHETLRLTRVEQLGHRYPHELSGGEAQRAALARALAPRPSILLLDEPMAGLDLELNQQMIELISTIRRQTVATIIYVTHNATEASSATDNVIMLRQGRVERIGDWASARGVYCDPG